MRLTPQELRTAQEQLPHLNSAEIEALLADFLPAANFTTKDGRVFVSMNAELQDLVSIDLPESP